MTFFKYSLLFSTILFLNSQDCWAMDNGDKEDVESFFKSPSGISEKKDVESKSFFKSPSDVCLHPPTLATFYHEDETIPKNLGPYGENVVERMLKKYQQTQNKNDIKIYTSSKKCDNGFDFVVVDDPLKKIVFLEVKSTGSFPLLKNQKQEKKYAFAVSCAKNDKEIFREVANTLQRVLRKNAKTKSDQLSRQWCASCSKDIKLVQSGDTKSKKSTKSKKIKEIKEIKESSELSLDKHLKSLITNENYKFMRVAALTIVHNQRTKPLPIPTYYAIVGDGNSEEHISDDPLQKASIVNAGLTFLWDTQELSLNEAQEYLYNISKELKKYRYPIEIINGSEKIVPEVVMEKLQKEQRPNTPSLKNDKKRGRSVDGRSMIQNKTPSSTKKPKNEETVCRVLRQFVTKGDYTKEKLKENLKGISEYEGKKNFKPLSGLLYKVLIKEPLEKKFLSDINRQFQKSKSQDLKTLNIVDLTKKMNESMEKGDEALKEFFKVSVLHLLENNNNNSPKKNSEKLVQEKIHHQNNQISENEEIQFLQDIEKEYGIDLNLKKEDK